jgi:hypothetical protein
MALISADREQQAFLPGINANERESNEIAEIAKKVNTLEKSGSSADCPLFHNSLGLHGASTPENRQTKGQSPSFP